MTERSIGFVRLLEKNDFMELIEDIGGAKTGLRRNDTRRQGAVWPLKNTCNRGVAVFYGPLGGACAKTPPHRWDGAESADFGVATGIGGGSGSHPTGTTLGDTVS